MNKNLIIDMLLKTISRFAFAASVLLFMSMLLHYVSNPLGNKLACQENKPVRQKVLCYRHTSSVSTTRSVHKSKNHGSTRLAVLVVVNQVG